MLPVSVWASDSLADRRASSWKELIFLLIEYTPAPITAWFMSVSAWPLPIRVAEPLVAGRPAAARAAGLAFAAAIWLAIKATSVSGVAPVNSAVVGALPDE